MPLLNYFIDFFSYLKKPVVPQRINRMQNGRFFIVLFLFSLLIGFLIDHFISGNQYLLKVLSVKDFYSQEKYVYSEGLLWAIIDLGVIAPLIEEYTQRYYLTSFTWNYTLLPFNICLISVCIFQVHNTAPLIVLASTSIIVSRILYKMTQRPLYKITMIRLYVNNYWLFFYISAIAFGSAHIFHYQIQNFIPLLPVFLVLPQIVGGIILGYIRIVMGLRWSIFFHALNNIACVLLLFIGHRN